MSVSLLGDKLVEGVFLLHRYIFVSYLLFPSAAVIW